jgi:hypothetical protein
LSINEFNTQIFSRTTKFSKERFIFFVAIQVYSEPLQLLKIFIDFKLTTKLSYILNSSSYAESVLKAVNLGGDTDTTAAATGGLAGIYYGVENIPQEWVEQIARKQDIIDLANCFAAVLSSSG